MRISRVFVLLLIITILFSTTIISFANSHEIVNEETYKELDNFKNEINRISNIIIAFAAVTSVLIFIIHFIRLAIHSSHPFSRRIVIKDIMVTGVCTALIGGISLIVKIYINVFA